MKNLFFVLFAVTIFLPFASLAKIVTILPHHNQGLEIDFNKPTHIITFGYSHGMGTLFVESAISRAYRYAEIFPNNQIVIVGNREKNDISDLKMAKKFGLTIDDEHTDLKPFTTASYMNFILKFAAIQSIDFYSHSSMHSGPALENAKQRFNTHAPRILELKERFLANAYIFIHGCNAGFLIAPELSEALQIPVAGALTSTDFQRIHQDQNWYTNNTDQYPSTGEWQKTNSISYSKEISCRKGACARMRPDNHPYHGSWGTYSGGLPFYKFFCNYQFTSHQSENDCYKSMAISLMAWPSIGNTSIESSSDHFSKVLWDFICPTDSQRKIFRECKNGILKALASGDYVFSPFKGNNTECSIKKCNIKTSCKYDDAGDAVMGTCKVATPKNPNPKTMLEEIHRYLTGFALLTGANP